MDPVTYSLYPPPTTVSCANMPKDENGYFITLKTLKNLKFGDQVVITLVSTSHSCFDIPKEIESDPDSQRKFAKFYFRAKEDVDSHMDTFNVSYIRSDGNPEKTNLKNLFIVS